MQTLALMVLIAAGGWLVAVGLLMALRPGRALHLLSLTASSYRANLAEQIPRLIAGAAMVVRAEVSKLPQLFTLGGWFIVASSVLLLVIPLAWHSGYALFWARRIAPALVRLVAPFSVAGGAGLIWAAW